MPIKTDRAFVLFPLATLETTAGLQYGVIAPASALEAEHEVIGKMRGSIQMISVDTVPLGDPVFGVSKDNAEMFLDEIECLAFFLYSQPGCFYDEIFSNRVLFTTHEDKGRNLVGINRYVLVDEDGLSRGVYLPDFPQEYRTWDRNALDSFEANLVSALRNPMYTALTNCIRPSTARSQDDRDKRRISIAVRIFNQSTRFRLEPTNYTEIVLLGAAFEALLNLPNEPVMESFRFAVKTLMGSPSDQLDKWCKEFYAYRSSLVHGDLAWQEDKQLTYPKGQDGAPPHAYIAVNVFTECLWTKLQLMGVLENRSDRRDFDTILSEFGGRHFQ